MLDITLLVEGIKSSWPAMLCLGFIAWAGREMILTLGGKVDVIGTKLDDHFNSCPNTTHQVTAPKRFKK